MRKKNLRRIRTNEKSKDENIDTIYALFTTSHKNAILIHAEKLRVSSKSDLTQMQQRFDFFFEVFTKEV